MTVAWLMAELQKADPKDEVILIVEDIGMGDVSGGICSKVLRSGEGAEHGKCEVYAKA